MTGSLIITIINVGKYLEHKAKMKILKISNEIFPKGKIFKDTLVTFIEPKNRKFAIEKEKQIEVCLLEKGQYIKIVEGD